MFILRDRPKFLMDQGEKLIEVNLGEEGKEAQPSFKTASLFVNLKETLFDLLGEFKDVLAWTYVEIPRLDPELATHQFNLREMN